MKQQIAKRLGVPHVRDTMMQFETGAITCEQAMESLQIGRSRLYDLRTSYLAASPGDTAYLRRRLTAAFATLPPTLREAELKV